MKTLLSEANGFGQKNFEKMEKKFYAAPRTSYFSIEMTHQIMGISGTGGGSSTDGNPPHTAPRREVF